MTLPPALANLPEDTAIVGDVDALIASIQSGAEAQHWMARVARRGRMFGLRVERSESNPGSAEGSVPGRIQGEES